MTDYTKLIEALLSASTVSTAWEKLMLDAAAAIEELQAEQKKTVTQIFGEEQMAWEGRCKDLMKYISGLQAEIRKSMQKCAECGDEQEQKAKELQAEVRFWKAAVKGQEDGIKVLQAEVERLQVDLEAAYALMEVQDG